MEIIFVTGIGTDVGKTVAASILVQALDAAYWKPIQAGLNDGTDKSTLNKLTSDNAILYPEVYRLNTPSSPHIAARIDQINININHIVNNIPAPKNKYLIVEGAGGIMVPLNEEEFVIDLIKKMNAKVILVSKNYLGSINHSLLTASVCKQRNIPVLGWIFNQQFMHYEEDIVRWSGYPLLHSIPLTDQLDKDFIIQQAAIFRNNNPSL